MALKFRFRWIPFLAAIVVAAIGIALGDWQSRRAQEKDAIEARLSGRESLPPLPLAAIDMPVEALEYRRVLVRGQFVSGWNVFLDNRPNNGVAGFQVVAPFRLAHDGSHVLVKRGWAPRDPRDRMRVPDIPVIPVNIEIEGMVRRNAGRVMQLGTPEPLRPGAIVQNIDAADFAPAETWNMHPFVLEQLSELDDGLVRSWPRPSTGSDRHRGYAFQWYGLAVAALMFFFVTGFTRGSSSQENRPRH